MKVGCIKLSKTLNSQTGIILQIIMWGQISSLYNLKNVQKMKHWFEIITFYSLLPVLNADLKAIGQINTCNACIKRTWL